MKKIIRIGSRKSNLAMVQSRHVGEVIRSRGGVPSEIIQIDTQGDRDRTSPLPAIGGKGLFTRELEDRLLSGDIDIAVHSLKDLPGELPEGLTLGAISKREDPRDALVSPGPPLAELPPGSRIGTGSVRRSALLVRVRGDVSPQPIRGNVPTRVRKLDEGEFDAVILAAAGLRRLGMADRITEVFETSVFIPSPGQGALGIECRADDDEVIALLQKTIADEVTGICCTAERIVQNGLAAGCSAPVGIHARVDGDTLAIDGFASDVGASRIVHEHLEGPVSRSAELANRLTDLLLENGADEILEAARGEA